MKFVKLTAITAAVLASTAALAADPVVYQEQNYAAATPAYQYDQNAGVIRNTTGAIFGTTKTLFNTAINPAAVSAEIGTLGYGANLAWSINDTTELQAGWAGGDVSDLKDDFDVDDLDYEIDDADFSNPYLGVQIRPAANWFTIGAGVIVPDNDMDIRAEADNGEYRIDNKDYRADGENGVGTLEGTLEHRNELAPYLTVGFRPNISDRWGIYGEIGAAYMGKTEAKLVASNGANGVTLDGTPDALRAEEVAREAERELEDEDWLEWFPIVKLGATYRF